MVAAAELPPPQALNSTAAMAINEAVMVFTTDLLLKFDTCAASIRQAAGVAQCGCARASLAATNTHLRR